MPLPAAQFAPTDAEAERRYQLFREHDPYPNVPAALLHSGHVESYVATTGMIHPFNSASLKPASYEVPIGGLCVYWDSSHRQQMFMLADQHTAAPKTLVQLKDEYRLEIRDSFELEANSIAFVTLLPRFRIPHYLALRFNLKIKHIYRGLLLGTGPLVDPGFNGYISLPLHNLTRQNYYFRAGEGIAWFEWTKTSLSGTLPENQDPFRDDPERAGARAPLGTPAAFPAEKLRRRDIRDYLVHANGGEPIESSMGSVIADSRKTQEEMEATARLWRKLGVAAFLGGIIGAAALVTSSWSLWHAVETDLQTDEHLSGDQKVLLKDLLRRVDHLEREKTSQRLP